jgi:hypothetical protein
MNSGGAARQTHSRNVSDATWVALLAGEARATPFEAHETAIGAMLHFEPRRGGEARPTVGLELGS